MPLQNRVTPFGEFVADPARGLFTGNRGCLCDEAGKLARRRWRLKGWITCQLRFKGWRRPVMQPGVWTELFFLDEATALAAGHRPCALCRRAAYNLYRRASARTQGLAAPPKAIEMDVQLHRERIGRDQGKRTFRARLTELPDGTLVRLPGRAHTAMLIREGHLMEWTAGGYVGAQPCPDRLVDVLTPKTSVMVLAAGYRPLLHASSDRIAAGF